MIKELTLYDIDEMIGLFKDNNFSDGWNKNVLTSSFSGGLFRAFGIYEGKLIALIGVSFAFDTADIEMLLVDGKERKKGYGKSLLSYAQKEIASAGKKSIFLEVREGNIPAVNLYSSCGYKKISVREKYYSDGENAVVLKKEIGK